MLPDTTECQVVGAMTNCHVKVICMISTKQSVLVQMVLPTMTKCKVIETCLECSARTLTFVGEVRHSHRLQNLLQMERCCLPVKLCCTQLVLISVLRGHCSSADPSAAS